MPAISDVKEEPWYLVPKDRFVYEIYSPPVHPWLEVHGAKRSACSWCGHRGLRGERAGVSCKCNPPPVPPWPMPWATHVLVTGGCGPAFIVARWIQYTSIQWSCTIMKYSRCTWFPTIHADSPDDQTMRQVGQLSLSASPESVNLLMGLPDAAVAMLLLGRHGLDLI